MEKAQVQCTETKFVSLVREINYLIRKEKYKYIL